MSIKTFFGKTEVKWYTVFFVIFSCILLFPFVLHQTTLVHTGDAYTQYFTAYVYIGRFLQDILHGKFYLYDFSIGYGEDIIESLNYYGFGDPFNIFAVFISEKNAAFLFSFFIFVRLYIAGIGVIAFLNYHHHTGFIVSGGGLIYAFSLYAVLQGMWFYTFLSAMCLFPFLIIQMEKVVNEESVYRNGVILAILIAIQGCCTYYFLYVQTLFIGLYWLIICDHPQLLKAVGQLKNLFFSYVTGICLSGAFLFPAISGLLHSSRSALGGDDWEIIYGADKLKLLFSNLLIPMLELNNLSLGIPILCYFVIIGCFLKRYIERKELVMTILLFVFYLSPAFGKITNGFLYANIRWIYVIYFWLAYITVEVLDQCKEMPIPKSAIVIGCILGTALIGLHFMVYTDRIRTFFYLLSVIGTAYVFWKQKKNFYVWCLNFCIFINIFFVSAPWQICGQDLYKNFVDVNDIDRLFTEKTEQTGGLRTDTGGITPNDSLVRGYYGTSEFLSVLNRNVYDFYEKFAISTGFQNSRHNLEGLDDRDGLRYIAGTDAWGYWFERAISEEQFETIPTVERQNIIIDTIVLDDDTKNREDYSPSMVIPYEAECDAAGRDGAGMIVDKDSSVILHLNTDLYRPEWQGGIYLELKGVNLLKRKNGGLTVNGKRICVCNEGYDFYFGTGDYLVKLDRCDTINITTHDDNIYELGDITVYYSDDEKVQAELEKQHENRLQEVKISNGEIRGTISKNKAGWLLLSVPYHKNWQAYIDGKKAETIKADIGFTAVRVEEGEHTVLMKYYPKEFILGCVCTFCAGIGCIILWKRFKD